MNLKSDLKTLTMITLSTVLLPSFKLTYLFQLHVEYLKLAQLYNDYMMTRMEE
jgi:hypothetical protein